MPLNKNTRLFKSIKFLAGANLISSILGAIGGILVARFVAPEINGQFRVFAIPLMYLTILHAGTFDGLYRQIPFYVGSNRMDQVAKIASAAGAWNQFISILVSIGFFVLAAIALGNGSVNDAAGWLTQILVCFSIFYGGYLGATYRTLDNFITLSKIQLIQAVTTFCMVLAVFLFDYYGLCLRAAIPAIVGLFLLHLARPLRNPLRFDWVAFKDVVRIGIPFSFWGTLYTSLWIAAEYSLILEFGGVVAVGWFSVAAIMRESICILPQSIQQVLLPKAVESFARAGRVKLFSIKTIRATFILTLLMVIIVLVSAELLEYLVQIVIPKYIEGLPLMKVSIWLAVIQAGSLPLNALTAKGQGWLYGRGIVAGLIIFALSTYFLIPSMGGVMAVVFGSLAGRFARTVVAYIDLYIMIKNETE